MSNTLERSIDVLVSGLHERWPGATYELDWEEPWQMLVATILAAQCTDVRVNKVTRTLFVDFPSPRHLASADLEKLEQALVPTGFFKKKARRVREVMGALVAEHEGEVPRSMRALTAMPGVARKTANVVLNCCFDMPTGIIVDTHVERVSRRMGLTTKRGPESIERDLMRMVPKDEWTFFGPAMVLHGRYVCKASAPDCASCPFLPRCARVGVEGPRPEPVAEDVVSVDEWVFRLEDELEKPYFRGLVQYLEKERGRGPVFPAPRAVMAALDQTPFSSVKVVILGQDPYHGEGQANGLSFSVRKGVAIPPTLRNIFSELKSDLSIEAPSHGDLSSWASDGVLLLNTILTVRERSPNAHQYSGWERFTDAVIRIISEGRDHVVFLLWGNKAQSKIRLIDAKKHTVLVSAHPSPLSARRGFFGSRPFSHINKVLQDKGQAPVNWELRA